MDIGSTKTSTPRPARWLNTSLNKDSNIMKKSFGVLFLLSILTYSAFSEDSDTGLAAILLDQTYQISKSNCVTRDPSNASLTEEAWAKWEDDNKEELAEIREMRLVLDAKFEKMALEDENRTPLEKGGGGNHMQYGSNSAI
jgi:hypothetical protein